MDSQATTTARSATAEDRPRPFLARYARLVTAEQNRETGGTKVRAETTDE